jgi:ABC-2 type transport system permease protein
MNNMTGHVFITFLLLFFGVCVTVFNLIIGYSSFQRSIEITGIAFLAVIPIITMRSLTEDRINRTDNLLFSLPLKVSEIIVGKFLAVAAVFTIPVLVMLLYPVALSAYGIMYYAASYSAILSLYLLGLALISICMYISSLAESQVISAVISFGILLFLLALPILGSLLPDSALFSFIALAVAAFIIGAVVWKLTSSLNSGLIATAVIIIPMCVIYYVKQSLFGGLFANILSALSLYDRFYNLNSGIFSISDVVYFISVTVFFLFLSVQSLEKRRWS